MSVLSFIKLIRKTSLESMRLKIIKKKVKKFTYDIKTLGFFTTFEIFMVISPVTYS